MNRKLYRSEKDKAICGVCAGFGRYFGVDPIIVRLIFVLAFLTYGVGLMFYLACALVIPKEPEGAQWVDVQSGSGYEEVRGYYGEEPEGPATRYEGAGDEPQREYYSAEAGPSEKKGSVFEGMKDGASRENIGVILIIIGAYLLIRIILPWFNNKFLLGLLALAAGIYVMKSGKR